MRKGRPTSSQATFAVILAVVGYFYFSLFNVIGKNKPPFPLTNMPVLFSARLLCVIWSCVICMCVIRFHVYAHCVGGLCVAVCYFFACYWLIMLLLVAWNCSLYCMGMFCIYDVRFIYIYVFSVCLKRTCLQTETHVPWFGSTLMNMHFCGDCMTMQYNTMVGWLTSKCGRNGRANFKMILDCPLRSRNWWVKEIDLNVIMSVTTLF